jgi:hypothetical protein
MEELMSAEGRKREVVAEIISDFALNRLLIFSALQAASIREGGAKQIS